MTEPLIKHRYRVVRALKPGGFSKTFLAEDTQLPSGRHCVVKQLMPIQDNPQAHQIIQQRFQREAVILETLGEGHGQIPRLYAYFAEGDKFYLVQEFIDGETLSDRLQAQGAMAEPAVRDLLVQILSVLDYIHGQQMIHRDIKPENIIIRRSDQKPVLIDFGAVKEVMGTTLTPQGNTMSSIVIGTPGFMPSEQLAGRPIYATDLYSLGLTAIYLLTGKHPQELSSDPMTGQLRWHDQVQTTISHEFATVLDQAIQPHGRDRFQTAQQMQAALASPSPSLSPTMAIAGQAHPPAPLPTPMPQTVAIAPDTRTGMASWQKVIFVGIAIGMGIFSGLYFSPVWEILTDTESTVTDAGDNDPDDPDNDTSDSDHDAGTNPGDRPEEASLFALNQFPQASCGDSLPSSESAYPVRFYPVWISYSDATLARVTADFCADAYLFTYNGQDLIQVSSFRDQQRAEAFRDFMIEQVGDGRVGEPRIVETPPERLNTF